MRRASLFLLSSPQRRQRRLCREMNTSLPGEREFFPVAYKVARDVSYTKKVVSAGRYFFLCLFARFSPAHRTERPKLLGCNLSPVTCTVPSLGWSSSLVFYPQPSATGTLAKARSTPNTNDPDKLGLSLSKRSRPRRDVLVLAIASARATSKTRASPNARRQEDRIN